MMVNSIYTVTITLHIRIWEYLPNPIARLKGYPHIHNILNSEPEEVK